MVAEGHAVGVPRRSPMSVERSWEVAAVGCAAGMILTMLASQIAPAWCSLHLSRAWARDCKTGMVVILVPPPSAMSVGRTAGARFPISSSASNSGGSSRAPGERAASRRAVSMRSSTNAATSDAELLLRHRWRAGRGCLDR